MPRNAQRSGAYLRLVSLALCGLFLAVATNAQATSFSAGEQLSVFFTQTMPAGGSSGTATFTLGTANAGGLFNITSFSTLTLSGGCLTCAAGFTDNLSGVLFNPATGGLQGTITGTFLGGGGGTHHFTITVSDSPLTWTFANTNAQDVTTTSSGTYTPASTVPEPASLILLGTGMLGIVGMLRRKLL